MQNAADGGIAIEPKDPDEDRDVDRNDAYHSVVSDLVSLIDHVQASLSLIESAIAREIAVGSPENSANVIVLDDVTPPYMRATAALRACDANLAIALHSLLDSKVSTLKASTLKASTLKASTLGISDYCGRSPALSIVGG
jgi:hypothetical protein